MQQLLLVLGDVVSRVFFRFVVLLLANSQSECGEKVKRSRASIETTTLTEATSQLQLLTDFTSAHSAHNRAEAANRAQGKIIYPRALNNCGCPSD